jgi:enoyl reductase-like protein
VTIFVLVAGSSFDGSDDIWPYLTGDWSKEFGVELMPFDGFLFAYRVMVSKEAHTSPSVKDLIVAAAGVDDSQWEGTYVKDTGGVITASLYTIMYYDYDISSCTLYYRSP